MYRKILHVAINEKFIPQFMDFIRDNFNYYDHLFFVFNNYHDFKIKKSKNVILLTNYPNKIIPYLILIHLLYSAKKIVIHGLWDKNFNRILFLQPWLLKKCYWIMWGGDFYYPEKQGWIKKQVIKRIKYLVTGTTGDYELAKKCYGVKGKHIKSFNYPSTLYQEVNIKPKTNESINILVGNSADPTNNHLEVFEKLKLYKDEDIKIIVPLSYGDQSYARQVIKAGNAIFGSKFQALTYFMPFENYLNLLSEIDIAIFNHKRQQAFSNIITLLGLGKKVFIRKESTLNGVFKEYGLTVFDSNNIDLQPLGEIIKEQNINNVKHYFSKKSLIKSLKSWIT